VTLLNPLPLLFASALLAIGCSAESGRILPIDEIDSGEPELGGSGGSDNGTGGMGTGGMIDNGTGGTDQGTGGAGTGGAQMDVAPDLPVAQDLRSEDAPTPPAPFVCNHVMGGAVLGQWFPSFEAKMDTTHWQELFGTGASIETWAMANSALWGGAVMSPCTTGSTRPDRVLLIVYSSTLTTQLQYVTDINSTITNIKTKYPGVKHIELLATLRGPNNPQMCQGAVALTVVPAYVDAALKAVADASAGMVTVGPKIAVPDCASWDNQPMPSADLTTAAIPVVGQLYVDYYKDHLTP
jgi:hypothetical protein